MNLETNFRAYIKGSRFFIKAVVTTTDKISIIKEIIYS
jgi:hypothetical protein